MKYMRAAARMRLKHCSPLIDSSKVFSKFYMLFDFIFERYHRYVDIIDIIDMDISLYRFLNSCSPGAAAHASSDPPLLSPPPLPPSPPAAPPSTRVRPRIKRILSLKDSVIVRLFLSRWVLNAFSVFSSMLCGSSWFHLFITRSEKNNFRTSVLQWCFTSFQSCPLVLLSLLISKNC